MLAMVSRARKPNWGHVMAGLRRGVAAGNAAAMTELAITINDGIRDGNGRVLVRRNAPHAVRLLRRAVQSGDENAAGSLGYAYDVGHGIWRDRALALECDRKRAIQLLKRANKQGDYPEAASLLAQLSAKVELTPANGVLIAQK
jgi:TPR repeat protein